jgi:hypothetical protein
MVRAKFSCWHVTHYGSGSVTAELHAVTGKPGEMSENANFNKATPSAELKITIDNPGAIGFFEPGKEYYADFTPAREV